MISRTPRQGNPAFNISSSGVLRLAIRRCGVEAGLPLLSQPVALLHAFRTGRLAAPPV